MIKHFINLTNGLEWIDTLTDYAFVRIESTAIEHGDWNRILRDLDTNLLMSLALGHECHVYDCGTNREISKTISQGIPFIKIQLHLYWLSEYEGKPLDIPAKTPEEQATKRKLIYFRRYLNTESIKLFGHSKATSHDGDKAYYRSLVH